MERTQQATSTVRLGTKLGFWLILAMASTAFAEVLSGSFPLPFLNPLGPVVVLPVYGLHAVVAVWAVCRFGRPRFATLYLAGVLFGMYEFVLTKVLWAPPWGEAISIGGIDWVAFIVLALFWHPLLALMIPLALTEALTTATRQGMASLPRRVGSPGRTGAFVLLLTAAVLHGALAGTPLVAAASVASTLGALFAVVWWWRRRPERTGHTLQQLQPSGRQIVWLTTGLVLLYLAFGVLVRPERIPGAGTLLLTFAAYGVVIALFLAALRRSRSDGDPAWNRPSWAPPRRPRLVAASYVALALAASIAAPAGLGAAIAVGLWLGAAIFGGWYATQAVRYATGGAAAVPAGTPRMRSVREQRGSRSAVGRVPPGSRRRKGAHGEDGARDGPDTGSRR